jgi:hypothetical protein
MAQLEDGRYLLATTQSKQPISFYISDEPFTLYKNPPWVNFSHVDRWHEPELRHRWVKFDYYNLDGYQNINLITECGSGDLYLVATGNRPNSDTLCTSDIPFLEEWKGRYCLPEGDERADLYRVYSEGNNFKLDKVDENVFYTNRGNFDAGVGVYADPLHRLYLYTTQHGHSGSKVWFDEFGPPGGDLVYPTPIGFNVNPGLHNMEMQFGEPIWWPGTAGYNIYISSGPTVPYEQINTELITGDYFRHNLNSSTSSAELGKSLALTPTFGSTFYYTTTTVDANGNESYPSQVVTATYGLTQLTIPDSYGTAGENIKLPINIPNADGLEMCSADIRLSYDPVVINPTGVGNTILTAGYDWTSQVITPGLVQAETSTSLGERLYGGGSLFDIYFDVTGQLSDTSTISFLAADSGIYTCDDLENPIALDLLDQGVFTVQPEYILGDLTGDGLVNESDADLALQISINAVEPTSEQLAAGDVNGDNLINAADAVIIMQMAAGTPVEVLESDEGFIRYSSQAGNVIFSLPSGLALSPGESTWVSLNIDDATNIAGSDIKIGYNPYIVDLLDIRTTSLTSNMDLAYNITQEGQIRISIKPKPGFEDGLAGGSGPFVELQFKNVDNAQGNAISPLNLLVVRLNDKYGRDFSSSVLQTDIEMVDGEIMVEDDLPPYVVYVSPAENDTNVGLNAPIHIQFSESMAPESMDLQISPKINLNETWNVLNTGVTLDHNGFDELTTYTAVIFAEDVTGLPMTQTLTWSFNAEEVDRIPPSVLGVSPPDGATGVSITPTLQITFNEEIHPMDLQISISPDHFGGYGGVDDWNYDINEPGTVYTASHNLVFTPDITYTLSISANDRYGNPLPKPYKWSFSTAFVKPEVEVGELIYLPLIFQKYSSTSSGFVEKVEDWLNSTINFR